MAVVSQTKIFQHRWANPQIKKSKSNENHERNLDSLNTSTKLIKCIGLKAPLPQIKKTKVRPLLTNSYLPKEINVYSQEEDKLTPDSWIKRSPHLIRLTGKHPLNAEPPLKLLYDNGFKTPNELFFVRNHGPVPKIEFNEHRLTITGLVKNKLVFTMEELLKMEMITKNVAFACTGNRRKELNLLKKSRGFNYGAGAIGTAEWTGVPLYKILSIAGIKSTHNAHVHLEGSDQLPKGSYDTSIPLLWCLDPTKHYMIALKMNGDPIPYDHGYPIRAILPGLTGGRMIKWLKTIRILEKESTNYYHINDNRVLDPFMDERYIANHEGVVERKEFCVFELNVQSVIVYPEHDEVIDTQTSDTYTIRGIAHTGGLRWINRVDISLNRGSTWRQAEIIRFEKVLTYDANLNMVFWEVELSTKDIYHSAEISVRAVDSAFNTQPENRTWNIMGMMNNSWYKLKLIRNDAFKVTCKHPTLPGAQGGGWMDKEKPTLKMLDDHELSALPNMSWEEINHGKENKNIIVMNNLVFDVTQYKDHPGGSDTLIAYNGEDCSDEFNSIHSTAAISEAKKFIVGKVDGTKLLSESDNLAAIIHKEYINDTDILFKLKTKKNYSSTKCFHVMLKHPDFEFARAYTPIDYDGDVMSIVIKIYEPKIPRFPSGGKFTQILKTMNIGEKLKVMGPFGELEYVEKGIFKSKDGTFSGKSFHFFGAGTGIAPIYSWVKKMHEENDRSLNVTVTHCCANENHALLKNEFRNLIKASNQKIVVNYIHRDSEGYINIKKLSEIVGRNVKSNYVFFLCGRQEFHIYLKKLLMEIGYSESDFFEF